MCHPFPSAYSNGCRRKVNIVTITEVQGKICLNLNMEDESEIRLKVGGYKMKVNLLLLAG